MLYLKQMSTIGRRILLVDDDEQLVTLLSIRLTKAGYAVTVATTAEDGYQKAQHDDYDVIVLDLILPRISGLEVCAKLRARGILTPVLILSGQTQKEVIIRGLNAGADDYLTKPFNDGELVARLKALLRRNKKTFGSLSLERSGLTLDVKNRTARCDEKSIILTKKETLLLKRLMSDAPEPVPRLTLLQDVWGIGDAHASNRLDVYVRRLRKKLETLCCDACVHTVRSGGYYFGKTPAALSATPVTK